MDSRTEDELMFIKAYAKMYKELPLIGKKTDGYNYKYAALESILAEWEPVFEKHGFLLEQFTKSGYNGEWDVVGSVLTHVETGLFRECTLTLPVGTDWQQTGSGVTYFKRYTVTALGRQPVGEDFDGLKDAPKAATKKKVSTKKASKANGAAPKEPHGVYVAIREFLKDCNTMQSLMEYYRKQENELDKLKDGSPEEHARCMAEFSSKKEQLQGAQN